MVADYGKSDAWAIPTEPSRALRLWRSRVVTGLLRYPPTLLAAIIVLVVVLLAIAGPAIVGWNPNQADLSAAFQAPALHGGPRSSHWLGTDNLGRDELARVIAGARVSMLVGGVGATASAIIGALLGLVAGWYRGAIGGILMRFCDLQLAFPFLIFAITITTVIGSGLNVLLIVFSVWTWGAYARVAEGMTLSLKHREFVEAARAIGAKPSRIILRHIAPQLLSPMLVLWSFSFAILIILEASLSFLGMGVRPPTASWGSMLSDGRQYLTTSWWLAVVPGIAISVTVWAINSIGDRLRDVLDNRIQL